MRVRIATLNVWGLPEPFSQQPVQRLTAIGEQLSSLAADAIAFQEVWTPQARRILAKAGARAGLSNVWYRSAAFGGSGLLVLSRMPIRTVRFERYVLRGLPERVLQGDYYGGKGFVRLELDTPTGPVSIVDTHLHARYRADVPHEYLALRTGQIVQLATALRDQGHPLVVVGDFNFGQQTPEHEILTGLTGLRDVAAELDRPEATVLRANPYRTHSRKPDRRIDFVFARDGGERAVAARTIERIFDEPLSIQGEPAAYSNHAGLLAELEIVPASRTAPAAPDAQTVALARTLLLRGKREAEHRRRGSLTWAAAGLGAAALVAVGERRLPRVTRRRLLRWGLNACALMALTPAVALSIVSEIFVPGEIEAFDELSRDLLALEDATGDSILA
jgi:endonuclease/exonuclease/phosphatase family metal-dependent hydrolase